MCSLLCLKLWPEQTCSKEAHTYTYIYIVCNQLLLYAFLSFKFHHLPPADDAAPRFLRQLRYRLAYNKHIKNLWHIKLMHFVIFQHHKASLPFALVSSAFWRALPGASLFVCPAARFVSNFLACEWLLRISV